MKHSVIFFSMLLAQQVKSQVKVTIARDTVVYRSEIIRNNLDGQDTLFRSETGTMYLMLQDGMPCWSPVKPAGAFIPNAISVVQPKIISRVAPPAKPRSLPKYREPKKKY